MSRSIRSPNPSTSPGGAPSLQLTDIQRVVRPHPRKMEAQFLSLAFPYTLYAFGVGAMFRALPPTRASTAYQVRSFADLFRRACEGTGKMLPTQGLNVSCQCIYTSPPSHPGAIPFSINSLMASEFFDNSESPMPRRTLAALLNWMFS